VFVGLLAVGAPKEAAKNMMEGKGSGSEVEEEEVVEEGKDEEEVVVEEEEEGEKEEGSI